MSRALVIGMGVSGAAAATALLAEGTSVRVMDRLRGDEVDRRAEALRSAGAEVVRTDVEPSELLADVDLVVASPGVAPHSPLLTEAAARALPVESEPELAWRLARGRTRLVVITGTNGKTTVTELVAACLGVPAAGNIGTPLTTLLAGPEAPPPLVVAELSSFQLHFASALAPAVSMVLNLAPDHLDWHSSFVAYAAAKARAWVASGPDDVALVNADDAEAAGLFVAHPPAARRARFSAAGQAGSCARVEEGRVRWHGLAGTGPGCDVVAIDDLARHGPHDLANACAAVAAAVAAGAEPAALEEPLRAFRPGPHRLEVVAEVAGVRYVDDSKATNPHAAAAALAAHPSVIWIAGGLNKGLSFDGLAPLLPGRVRAALTIGSSGPALAAVARGAGVPVVQAGTLDVAVAEAAVLAEPGDVVLLAPACASMDQFRDYAERGAAFRTAVARLVARDGGRPAPVEDGGDR